MHIDLSTACIFFSYGRTRVSEYIYVSKIDQTYSQRNVFGNERVVVFNYVEIESHVFLSLSHTYTHEQHTNIADTSLVEVRVRRQVYPRCHQERLRDHLIFVQ